jgi:hypothetical protein
LLSKTTEIVNSIQKLKVVHFYKRYFVYIDTTDKIKKRNHSGEILLDCFKHCWVYFSSFFEEEKMKALSSYFYDFLFHIVLN